MPLRWCSRTPRTNPRSRSFEAWQIERRQSQAASAPRLLPHLIGDALAMAVLDQLIVAAALLERQIGEKHHQDHHPDDRDVVRHGQDFEKLLKSGDMAHRILDARLGLAMI